MLLQAYAALGDSMANGFLEAMPVYPLQPRLPAASRERDAEEHNALLRATRKLANMAACASQAARQAARGAAAAPGGGPRARWSLPQRGAPADRVPCPLCAGFAAHARLQAPDVEAAAASVEAAAYRRPFDDFEHVGRARLAAAQYAAEPDGAPRLDLMGALRRNVIPIIGEQAGVTAEALQQEGAQLRALTAARRRSLLRMAGGRSGIAARRTAAPAALGRGQARRRWSVAAAALFAVRGLARAGAEAAGGGGA